MREHHEACQRAIASLAATFRKVSPDVAVIIGDDQEEVLLDDNMPAFMIYWGDKVDNVPMTAEQAAKAPPGIAIADWGHHPPQPTVNPCEPKLALHVIDRLIEEEFDVAHSRRLPAGRHEDHSIPHAYGFVYRRVMSDPVIPNVPVFINTFYPPNQPRLRRCYKFGKALGRAIRSWDSDKTVAVFASGGLSHFVIEEDLDHDVLDALKAKDDEKLTNLPEAHFNAGTSEIRNWIALAGAIAESDLKMELVDYVPCYRSLAGTGNAMGFATWM
jgi:OH-DDVA oxygenase/3-O-methylgallate 3,4-dioxygenase